jgi:hypothetical protein
VLKYIRIMIYVLIPGTSRLPVCHDLLLVFLQLQQSCAIGKLQLNLKEYGAKAHETIFPVFTASLDGYSETCQILAAEALTSMLPDESLAKEVSTNPGTNLVSYSAVTCCVKMVFSVYSFIPGASLCTTLVVV